MRPYLLVTPGTFTPSETLKGGMMSDWWSWDEG